MYTQRLECLTQPAKEAGYIMSKDDRRELDQVAP